MNSIHRQVIKKKGRRPALVISNKIFNHFTKIAVVCPITNTNREFPLHIPLDERTKTTGVIMCEQVKSLDIIARNASFLEKAPKDIVEEAADTCIAFFEVLK